MTFPVYLYAALRFPNQLPQVIAVAVVVIGVSLIVVVAAEVGRRVAERRLGARDRLAGSCRNRIAEHRGVLRLPRQRNADPGSKRRDRLVGEAIADDATCSESGHGTACTCRGRRSPRSCPRAAILRPSSQSRPPRCGPAPGRTATRSESPLARTAADRHDDALVFVDTHHGVTRRRPRRPSARARSASR